VRCPSCGQVARIRRGLLGKQVRCPNKACNRAFVAAQSSETPAVRSRRSWNLRLADVAHPARRHLEQVTKIVDQYVEVEVLGDRTALKASFPTDATHQALSTLDAAVALCPDDCDLLVAKACILHASGQFKSAEEMLDVVLGKDPAHFEARTWKNHWQKWKDALRFPKWEERTSSLHPVMAAHLRLGHQVQVVRDGLQKTLAIVCQVEGPPFDNRTTSKVQWVLSQTPHGPLVAFYLRLVEPIGEPSTTEGFLPIFSPEFIPEEGYSLVQQLAFTPYCFAVCASGSNVLVTV
jgi:hypothetical protein